MYKSKLLSIFPNVVHGFSSRHYGDMRKAQRRTYFAKTLGIPDTNIYKPRQVHGTTVSIVAKNSNFLHADGLVSKGVPICVISADCVPLIAVDPVAHIFGVAHAGWRGTLGGIAGNLIEVMLTAGADKNYIRVAIGPHIGHSCYNVPEERALIFMKKFKKPNIVTKIAKEWHVGLGQANAHVLLQKGIMKEHIDFLPFCTSCDNHDLYSFRKDDKSRYGEIISMIGSHETN